MANAWILPPLAPGAISASSTAVGAVAHLLNDYAGVIWRSGAGATATITLDLGADAPVDTVALFGIAGPSPAATLRVDLTPSGGAAVVGATLPLYAGTQMPVSGRGIALWSAASPTAARYVTITVSDTAAFSIEAARVVACSRIQLERNFDFGAGFGVRDLGSFDFSARGVALRRRSKKLRTVALTFSNVRKDEVEAITKPLLERIGNTEMIALVTDPAADAARQGRCYYGPIVGDLGQTWRKANAFEAKANLVSIF